MIEKISSISLSDNTSDVYFLTKFLTISSATSGMISPLSSTISASLLVSVPIEVFSSLLKKARMLGPNSL